MIEIRTVRPTLLPALPPYLAWQEVRDGQLRDLCPRLFKADENVGFMRVVYPAGTG